MKTLEGVYLHQIKVHEGLGHCMDSEDTVAFLCIKNNKRNPIPQKIFWKQDDRHHTSFYWVGVPEDLIETEGEIVV